MGWSKSASRRRFLILAAFVGVLLALPASALATAGDLYSVGDNREGELGNTADNVAEVAHPTPYQVQFVGSPGPIAAIAAAPHSSFGVTGVGQLYGFGENYYGQLGNSDNNLVSVEEFPAPNPYPTQVILPGLVGDIVEVAAGRTHTLVRSASNQLYAFGQNYFGQLGNSTNNGVNAKANPTPTLVTLPGATGPPAQISAGDEWSLVVTTTGQLFAFGNNRYGQLGNFTNSGTNKATPTPTLVVLPGATGPVVLASAGERHSLAVTSTGQIFSWGGNDHGQLGRSLNFGTSNPNPVPEAFELPAATGPVVQASAGFDHSLVATSTGQLYGFGENFYGQLGVSTFTGTSTNIPVPQLVPLPGATGPVVRVLATSYDGYALTSTGQLFGFGSNRWGQLATPANIKTVKANAPAQISVGGGESIAAVAGGDEHTLILTGQPPAAVGGESVDPGGGSTEGKAAPQNGPAANGAAAAPRLLALTAPQKNVSLAGRLVGGRCVDVTAANRDKPSCRQKLALPLGLTLSADAKVTVEIERLTQGRKRRGVCVAPTGSNRKLPACTRSTPVGKPTVQMANAGADKISVSGPALAPGRYAITVTPSIGGAKGEPKTTTITVTG